METNLTNITTFSPEDFQDEALVSDNIREQLEQVIIFIMLPLNIMGVVTNIINAMVFTKQGLQNDSTTIGLLSLAVVDMLGCVCMIPYSCCYIAGYVKDTPTKYICIAYATNLCYPHIVFSHCNTWITVYISLERSLCVVIPLKVKMFFTAKVTIIAVISIFLFFLANQLGYSVNTRVVWQFDPKYNQNIAYNYETPTGREYLYINSIFSNTVLSSLAIIIVSITTGIMIHRLNVTQKWRRRNTSARGKSDGGPHINKPLAFKEIELMKAVTTVTIIFLICLSMSHIPATAVLTLHGVSFSGINRNIYFIVYMVRFLFDALNSSINFFLYIRISSRYKKAFSQICGKEPEQPRAQSYRPSSTRETMVDE